MKKISKMALLAVAGMIAIPQAFAQEAEEEFAETEEIGYSEDFGGDFGFESDEVESPTYFINAETGVDMRGYIGTYADGIFNSGYETKSQAEVFDSLTSASAYANMKLGYSAQNSEMEFKLKFNNNSLGEYNQDILDEATARLFLGNWVVEGGKMKVVWGKGDKLHVLDNFNATDYTDFIFGDYLDRRIAEPMLRVKYNVPNSNWSVEGVYTPMMTADRFASSGIWAPAAQSTMTNGISKVAKTMLASAIEDLENARLLAAQAKTLKDLYTQEAAAGAAGTGAAALQALITNNATTLAKYGLDPTNALGTAEDAIEAYLTAANTTYTNALTNASAMSSDSSVLYPDTNQLRYGQAGIRVLGTLGSVDVGASYYYGHYKQPSFNAYKLQSALETYLATGELSEEEKFLAYDQKQTFGLEAAFVVWKFNTRWELAYNLTKDSDGKDPFVHNNSVEWLAGFDVNLPIHNMNLNVQETGKYILNSDKIKDNTDALKLLGTADLEYNSDDNYINNRLVMNLSDTFLYENLKPEITTIWGIENNEWCVQPKVNYKVADGMNLGVSGGVIYCWNENGEFYNFTADSTKWHTKSFVQATVRYEF